MSGEHDTEAAILREAVDDTDDRLGMPQHATRFTPLDRVTVAIDGTERAGAVGYAEEEIWAGGNLRVMLDGEKRTRIVSRDDVRPVAAPESTPPAPAAS